MNGRSSSTGVSDANASPEQDPCKGREVFIADGPLKGFEGIVVDRRPSGRYLVQLFQGVLVETELVRFS